MKRLSMLFAGLICAATFHASAAEADFKTVASVYQNSAALAGQSVRLQGKVVKVVSGIKKRNFVHIQDGTGDANSNDLIVISKQTATVGDQVTVSGVVVTNRDFGSGYFYPLLLEDSSIEINK